MASLTIRDLDDKVKERLRVQAARHSRSMEAEARSILTSAVKLGGDGTPLGSRIHGHFAGLGDVELDLPERGDLARAAEL